MPAHRLMWEERTGIPAPARAGHLRPIDGDWTNLNFENWEIVSLRTTRKAQVTRQESSTKDCTECGERLPLGSFPARRNICKDCHKSKLRVNWRNREEHARVFRCEIVNGVHYHLRTRGAVLDFWIRQWFVRMKGESRSSEDRYRLLVAHARAQLRRGVVSGKQEVKHGEAQEA